MAIEEKKLPVLPDTSDPFELLGVEPGANKAELKRAYVARIQIYRPEKAPTQFQRLNEAFEEAMQMARSDSDDERDAGESTTADPAASQSVARYIDALMADQPVAGDLLDEHDVDEIDTGLLRPGLSWRRLAGQTDREAAVYLFGRRLQLQLLDGAVDEVFEQLQEPELLRDAYTEPVLEVLALRALSTIAWTYPDESYHLYGKLRSDSTDKETQALYEAFENALIAAKAWQLFSAGHQCPDPLERFLLMALSAGPRTLEELVSELRSGMRETPEEYLATLDLLRMSYPPIFVYLLLLAERFSREPEPTLAELTEDKRGKLSVSLQTLDSEVREHKASYLPLALGLAGLTALVMMSALGAAGLALAGGFLGTAAYLWVGRERNSYRELIRPRLARTVANLGTPPGTIVSWLLAHGSHTKRLKSFDIAVEGDHSLDALSRFARMARVYDRPDD